MLRKLLMGQKNGAPAARTGIACRVRCEPEEIGLDTGDRRQSNEAPVNRRRRVLEECATEKR